MYVLGNIRIKALPLRFKKLKAEFKHMLLAFHSLKQNKFYIHRTGVEPTAHLVKHSTARVTLYQLYKFTPLVFENVT